MKEFSTLLTETQDNLLIIFINREDKLNALNKTVIAELNEVIDLFIADDSLRGAILTGKGNKAFVAGADIAEFSDFDESQGADLAEEGQRLLFDFIANKIMYNPDPVKFISAFKTIQGDLDNGCTVDMVGKGMALFLCLVKKYLRGVVMGMLTE